ncbi:MAG TPA: DUF6159 family protein [Actinomycetota bacterium]|jgi:hypothetical protein|nr:DUF6159 family protein [Actinomycetota bacterium]
MERISRGFRLLRASWDVLRSDKELLVLPLISFVLIALVTASLAGAAWAGGLGRDRESLQTADYIYLGIFYFVSYFIGIFFNAAVVGAATIRLQGGDPSVRDGLRLAASKTSKIAGWAAISATVGLILRALEERAGFIGDIIIGLIGVVWGAITFFVVPVLLYEPVGPIEGIKRSAGIFKQRWGEQFTGNVAIGLAMFIIALPAFVLAGALTAVSVPLGLVVGVLVIGTVVAIGSALSGVFQAALYRFATTGQAGGAFAQQDLQSSFRPRR